MKKFKNYLPQAACCMMLLFMVAFINVGQAVAAQAVTVTNTPLPVREVADPAKQPFQAMEIAQITDLNHLFQLATVPAGKRLVIEYASAGSNVTAGTKMVAVITTTAGGNTVSHSLVMVDQGLLQGSLNIVAAQPMRLYADPGTPVTGIIWRDSPNGGGGNWGMTISGYFVDVP